MYQATSKMECAKRRHLLVRRPLVRLHIDARKVLEHRSPAIRLEKTDIREQDALAAIRVRLSRAKTAIRSRVAGGKGKCIDESAARSHSRSRN